MDLGGYSAVGPREANEDNYYVVDFSKVGSFTNGVKFFVMVSDGMGGYQGGDVASGLAVSSAESYIGQLLDMAAGNRIEFDAAFALGEIAQNAHEAILAESRNRGNTSMGATFIGAFLSSTHAWIGHIGDSRAYLVRNDDAIQLTTDHSQVGRMLASGLLTEEEAQNHPARNRIERALGFSDGNPEITEVDLAPGDALMLCSDGVYTVVDCDGVADCVMKAKSAENAATRIVKSALSLGTDDNSTAVVALNVERGAARPARRGQQPTIRTSASSLSSGAPTGRYRAVSRSSRGQSSRQRQSGKRSVRSIVIPIAVVVVLAAAIAAFFIMSGGLGTGGGAVDASQVPSASASTATSSQQQDGHIAASISTTAQYAVGYDATLKYVDKDGIAHRFGELGGAIDAPEVLVQPGSSVTANTEALSYSIPGRMYRALSPEYLNDLRNDLAAYSNRRTTPTVDALSFGSNLSRIIDSESYVKFIEALAEIDERTLWNALDMLVLDQEALSPEE